MSDRPAETEYSALQALLQIRTNAGGEGNATGEAGDCQSANDQLTPATTINANANIANLLRMGAKPAAILQQAQRTYSPAQLVAMRGAAVAAAAATRQHANGTINHGNLLQAAALQNPNFTGNALPNQFLEAMARDPALMAATVATAPRAPTLDLPRSPTLSPLRTGTIGPSPGGAISPAGLSLDSPAISESQEAAEKKIRKDEVEAALRSKPQRGRKRENLNAEERLELTRTRNREHAKSTRIRKKARYQELLDTEHKYLELKGTEDLESKRRETVMGFLGARASMLRTTVDSTLKLSKEGSPDSQEFTKENRQSAENRAISFDQAETTRVKAQAEGASTLKSGLKADESAKSLKDFLLDESTFSFETTLGDIHTIDASAMTRFDDNVGRHLVQMVGPEVASCRIDCRVLGSTGGVALNKDGTGFAKVEHVVGTNLPACAEAASSKEGERVLLLSLVSFEFAKASRLLKAVAWCILKDGMGVCGSESVNGSKSDSTAKESLESQIVYPSVVSFEEAQREKAKDKIGDAAQLEQQEPPDQESNDQRDNPGMSINL